MIKPIDIETKDFKKVALGYSQDEVDEFLDEILIDYHRLYKERVDLKDKIDILNQDLDYYRSIEKSLQKTLALAEKKAEEIKEAAELEKQEIEKQAQIKAEEIIGNTKQKLSSMETEISKLVNQYELMKKRVKLLLYAEIDLLDKTNVFEEEVQEKRGE